LVLQLLADVGAIGFSYQIALFIWVILQI